MSIIIKRVYNSAAPEDGYRILVDQLWPRGLSKDKLKIDEWLKEVAPSNGLRKSYHLGEISWGEFERRYLLELEKHQEKMIKFLERHQKEHITLLFSSKNEEKNNASVLREYLMKLKSKE